MTDSTTASTKAHAGRVPGWAFVVLLALVATMLGWPGRALRPVAGLDPSWILGLHIARDAGLHVGQDLAFTFGPLGFLTRPIRIDPQGLYALGVLVRGGAMFATAWVAARHLVRLLGSIGGTVATLLLVPLLLVPFGRGADPELLVVFPALALVALARRPTLAWWHGAVGLLAGVLLFLAKVSSGFTVLGLWVGWSALSLVVRRREPLAWTLVAWAASAPLVLIVGGLLTGFDLAGLVSYVRNGVELTSGFAAGMFRAHPATAWHLLGFALGSGLVVAGVTLRLRAAATGPDGAAGTPVDRPAVGREVVALLVLAAFAFTRLKYGFTREGPGHLLPAVGAMVLLGLAGLPDRLALPSGRHALGAPHEHPWRRPVIAVPLVALAAMVIVLRGVADAWVTPGHAADALDDLVSLVSSDDGDPRGDLLRQYGLGALAPADADPPGTYVLPPGTLHVDPWDTALVWALGREGQWTPPPVFQSYSAYTPALDRLNAEHLAGPDAPDVVLRLPKMIDGRNPAWDPPRHLLALACNYDLAEEVIADTGEVDAPIAARRWEVLTRRSQARCDALGRPELEVQFPMVLGRWFDRPAPACGDRLTTFTLGYEADGVGAALRTLAWLPPEVRVEAELADGRTASWRWLPAFAGEPMLLDAPADVAWALRGSSSQVTRLRVVRSDDVLQPGADHPFVVTAGCL